MRDEITSARMRPVSSLSEEQRIHLIGALPCRGILRSPALRGSDGGVPVAIPTGAVEPAPRIVGYLRRHPTASPAEMRVVLSLSRSQTYRALRRLLLPRQIGANVGRTSAAADRLVDFDPSRN